MRFPSRTTSPSASQATSSDRQYFDRRGEVNELKSALRAGIAERDMEKIRENIKKVIMYMTLGIDMSRLFSEMIMASQLGDTVQKKMVYLYLTTYAEENADLAILAVNTLQKDTKDVDPSVRGLALRSLCSLHLPNMIEYLEPAIAAGLTDPNGYVRKTAVMGVLKFSRISSPISGFLEQLKIMTSADKDVNVISNCIVVLSELNALNSLVNQALVYSLLNRFGSFSEWSKCFIIDKVLSAYEPESTDELFNIFNALDVYLKQTSVPVSFGILKLFLNWTTDDKNMTDQVIMRIKDPLLTLLSSASASIEMQHVILSKIGDLSKSFPSFTTLLTPHWKSFLLGDYDTVETGKLKLDILSSLENKFEIINEMKEYLWIPKIETFAIESLVKIVCRPDDSITGIAPQVLTILMETAEYTPAAALCGIRDILFRYPENVSVVTENPDFLRSMLPKIFSNDSALPGLEALVWILGEYGSDIEEAPYSLESIFDEKWCPSSEELTPVLISIIHAALKLFFKRPLEMRSLLERVMYAAIEESSNPDVRDTALMYWRMLKQLGPKPIMKLLAGHTHEGPPIAVVDDSLVDM
jgi:AP-4 complex subunit beta-1